VRFNNETRQHQATDGLADQLVGGMNNPAFSQRLQTLEHENIGLRTDVANLEGLLQSGRELDQARLGASFVFYVCSGC
jgi:hypothetical protein